MKARIQGFMQEFVDDGMSCTGAEFSWDGVYRYTLFRKWNDRLPTVLFLMLNPSTADAINNDPTVDRCQVRATSWGYGRLEVCNIFALRSTDPAALYAARDPIGEKNNAAICQAAAGASMIVCAWGKHGLLQERGQRVRTLLQAQGFGTKLHYLRMNKDGTPSHPLYLPYSIKPERWLWT